MEEQGMLLDQIINRLRGTVRNWYPLDGWDFVQTNPLYSGSPYAYLAFQTAKGLATQYRDKQHEDLQEFQDLMAQNPRARSRTIRQWGKALEKQPKIVEKAVRWLGPLRRPRGFSPGGPRKRRKRDETGPPMKTQEDTKEDLFAASEMDLDEAAREQLERESAEEQQNGTRQEGSEGDLSTRAGKNWEQAAGETLRQESEEMPQSDTRQEEHSGLPQTGLKQELHDDTVKELDGQSQREHGGEQSQSQQEHEQVPTEPRRERSPTPPAGLVSAPIFERRIANMTPQEGAEGDPSRHELKTYVLPRAAFILNSANTDTDAPTHGPPPSEPQIDGRFPHISSQITLQHHELSGTLCLSGASPVAVKDLLPQDLFNSLNSELLSSRNNTIVPSVEMVFFGPERLVEQCRIYLRIDAKYVRGFVKTLLNIDIEERDGYRFLSFPHTKSRIVLTPGMLMLDPPRDRLAAVFGEELSNAVLKGPIANVENGWNPGITVTEAVALSIEPELETGAEIVLSIGRAEGETIRRKLFGDVGEVAVSQ